MEEFSGDDLSGLNWRHEKGEYIKTFSYITYFKMLSIEELRSLRRKKKLVSHRIYDDFFLRDDYVELIWHLDCHGGKLISNIEPFFE